MKVNQIICGDCLPIMRDMADNSVGKNITFHLTNIRTGCKMGAWKI